MRRLIKEITNNAAEDISNAAVILGLHRHVVRLFSQFVLINICSSLIAVALNRSKPMAPMEKAVKYSSTAMITVHFA
jgi:hypothetical protein